MLPRDNETANTNINLNVTFASNSLFPPATYHSHFSCPTMHAV
jgi:hypothetical protein